MDNSRAIYSGVIALESQETDIIRRTSAPQRDQFTTSDNNNGLSRADQHQGTASEVLSFDVDLPEGFRTPFIKTRYRAPGLTLWQCFLSLFEPTNETINVWSHVIALALFIVRFLNVFTSVDFDRWCFPLVCFALGISSLMAMSSVAHLINCVSLAAHHIGFYLDYAAISVYSFAGSQAFFFYSRPPPDCHFSLLRSPGVFLTVSAIMSCMCTCLCCASRHRWGKYRYVIRTSMFMVYFIIVTSPFTYRIMSRHHGPETSRALHYFNRHIVNYILTAFVNVTKLPERYIPRVFDFLGQSHHFLHVLAALGAADAFSATHLDMLTRKDQLEDLQRPDVFSTFGVFAAVSLTNVAIVFLFSRALLKSEKEKPKRQ